MYFVYGCPKVLYLKPEEHSVTPSNSNSTRTSLLPPVSEEILAIAFNPSGSLLAVASTSRLCVWSGGKDHVPLGSLALQLRGLSSGGTTLLWRRDSSCVGVVSAGGKLALVSVSKKAFGATAVGVGERFAVPDWYEPQHTRVPLAEERSADNWADPGEAELALQAVVEQIFSDVSAMCLGRFGQHILAATTDGEIYGVSWEGQILCRYGVVAMPTASPRSGVNRGPRSSPTQTRFVDVCASSMSFNDTLQLLALTTTDGSFFLGTLSKDHCWLRNIAITEQAVAHHQHTRHTASTFAGARPPGKVGGAHDGGDFGGGGGNVSTPGAGDNNVDVRARSNSWSSGSWGWGLLGKGREAVVAAAAAAADVLSSPRSSSQQTFFSAFPSGGGGGRGNGFSSPSADDTRRRYRGGAAGVDRRASSLEADCADAAGAVGVEFSAKGCLMAVALVDGTVLLTRVERYTSGIRAHHKLQISSSMLHRSDSYRLQVPPDEMSATNEARLFGSVPAEADAESALLRERSSSIGSLWGVEVHHLHCLTLQPWVGDGDSVKDRGFTGPAGRVLSMCFSFDGWALSVGHEHALTVWSTEDGTRLVCTLSETGRRGKDAGHTTPVRKTPTQPGAGSSGGASFSGNKSPPLSPAPNAASFQPAAGGGSRGGQWTTAGYVWRGGAADKAGAETSRGGDAAGDGGAEVVTVQKAAGGTLDLVAGGARSLTWETEGYRLLSVGGALPGEVNAAEKEEGGAAAVVGKAQGIVAFDFLRRARSNLSSALLSLQGSDRIALVDSQPWSAQVLLWRVLPVHPGYLSTNAPLRHVSTSRAGTYVAVAGSRGLAIYSRPTGRWRIFGNIEQEQEVAVAGMCWWGESALVVASRLKHGFILLLYSRKHLDAQSLLLPPIRLPVGMRPLFMQGVQEGGSRPTTDVLFLLVAGSGSYLLYRFSCDGDVLERGNVSFSVLHEGALPHVLENMDDMRQLDQVAGLGSGAPPVKNNNGNHNSIPSLSLSSSATTLHNHANHHHHHHHQQHTNAGVVRRDISEGTGRRAPQTDGALIAAGAAFPPEAKAAGEPGPGAGPDGSNARLVVGDAAVKAGGTCSDNSMGMMPPPLPSPSPSLPLSLPLGSAELFSPGYAGSGSRVKAAGLPEIGPPKRVMLLPEVHPRSIALLDYDGNLVTMQLSNGEVKAVAEGVESVIDLSGVSEAWEAWEVPLLIHPCYLLQRRGRVGGGGQVGGKGWGQGPAERGGSEEMSEEYSVWCPAMRLDPCPPSVKRLLRGGGGVREALSPVLSLNPGASCDPERVDLGLQPLLGTMVHVSQVVCRPRVANTPLLPPCYELRTHLRPILHMVLRHLLIVSQLQLLDSKVPSPATADPTPDTRRQHALSLVRTGSGAYSDQRWAEAGGNGSGGGGGSRGAVNSSSTSLGVQGGRSGGGNGNGIVNGNTSGNSSSADQAEPRPEESPADAGGGRCSGSGNVGIDDTAGVGSLHVGNDGRSEDAGRENDGPEEGGRRVFGLTGEGEEGAGVGMTRGGREGEGDGEGKNTADMKERDWIGTSSDGFEIAIAVLKRCREDDVLVEALPDTLELLVRACMEALDLAGPRARNEAIAVAAAVGASKLPPRVNGNNSGSGNPNGYGGKVVSELELARAVMADCVYLAQLAPECFHEVVARVARKAEPELYSLLFPVHLVSGRVEGGGLKDCNRGLAGGGGLREEGGGGRGAGGRGWGRWVHPTHLFHECVLAGRLTTAAWYLPLVRDDVAHDAWLRHVGPHGPLSDAERERFMPLEMWSLLSKDWAFGLGHALACVLLAESLSSKQHAFLPEVWMFATKREQSAPLHHSRNKAGHHARSSSEHSSSNSSNSNKSSINDKADHYWRNGNVYRAPWFKRGQGAVMEVATVRAAVLAKEARQAQEEEEARAGEKGGKGGRHRTSGSSGDSFGGGVLGANLSWGLLRKDSALLASQREAEEEEGRGALLVDGGQNTLFSRRSALRLRALRRPGRLGYSGNTDTVEQDEGGFPGQSAAGDTNPPASQAGVSAAAEPGRNDDCPNSAQASRSAGSAATQRTESERTRVYHLPFSRDAASVVSRFLWEKLNDLKVKVVLRSFQSLASSSAAREAGLDPGKVLGALTPARRSMVSSARRSPAEVIAGLVVAIAEMFKMSVEDLSLFASTRPGAAAVVGGSADGMPTASEQQQTHVQAAAAAVSHHAASVVRPQLVLLGDLSRAVGHGEAALLCASLLRDEEGAVGILRNASQTLRVGYGQFVSDLQGQLQKAHFKAREHTTGPSCVGSITSTPSPSSFAETKPQQLAGAGEQGMKARTGSGGTPEGLVDEVMGGHVEAVALHGLQQFGGSCVRSLASF